ncbi:MAG: response regulator [Myxococcales bacterium]|nr:response regulator [Myxococcales bacterium]
MSQPEALPTAELERLRARVAELEQASSHQVTTFLQALLEALPAVVIRFDADLRIRFVSRVLPGLHERDILGAPALDFIPREDRARALAAIQAALGTGRPEVYDTAGPGPNGESRSYQVFVAPVREENEKMGGCFVAIDTSHLRERERTLAETEQKLRIALASTKLGLWSWDLASGELIWDDRMKQLVGRADSLNLPDYVEQVVHPDDRDEVRRGGERAMATGRVEATPHRIVRPDGEVRWMLTIGEVELDAAGRPVRLTGGNLDITEQRALEEQLRRSQKMEAVGQLTAGIAHNFNNMLMGILPSLELLRRIVPASHMALLDDATSAADRGADMVRKLMTFAGQRRSPDVRSCDAGALARHIVGMCERAFDRHITLHCEVSATTTHARASAADLEQILMNLLLNARDALLEVERERPQIDVLVGNESDAQGITRVVIRVRDNGSGMSDLAKKHAFEPFFTSKEVGRGTGLGLATSYALVRDLGGQIDIESGLGVGTTVAVHLPTTAAPAEAQPAASLPAQSAAGAQVLVVDDEPLIRRLTQQVLEEKGYRVRTASDGAAALAELAREPADVILLDRSMPGAPGSQLLRALRESAPTAKVAYFTGQEVTPDEHSDVDAVILKPIHIDALERIVADLARGRA